jgi:branched-chain amino acid transport system substrate-binding protein
VLKELNANVEVTTEYYDPTQPDVTAQVQRLKRASVTVLACAANPVATASMMKAARELLDWDVPFVLASYSAFGAVAELAGYDNMEGAVTTMYGHTAWETDIPAIAEIKRLMADVAPDVAFSQESYGGWAVSGIVAIVLKRAGPDLTREAFLDAAESGCRFIAPDSLAPWSWSPTDHDAAEALMFVRGVVDRSTDPPTTRWEPFGDLVDFESTKDCVVPTPPPGAEDQPGPSIQEH